VTLNVEHGESVRWTVLYIINFVEIFVKFPPVAEFCILTAISLLNEKEHPKEHFRCHFKCPVGKLAGLANLDGRAARTPKTKPIILWNQIWIQCFAHVFCCSISIIGKSSRLSAWKHLYTEVSRILAPLLLRICAYLLYKISAFDSWLPK